jgi:hypothetical protein
LCADNGRGEESQRRQPNSDGCIHDSGCASFKAGINTRGLRLQ